MGCFALSITNTRARKDCGQPGSAPSNVALQSNSRTRSLMPASSASIERVERLDVDSSAGVSCGSVLAAGISDEFTNSKGSAQLAGGAASCKDGTLGQTSVR